MATVTRYPASYSVISGTVSGTRYRNCIGKGSSTTASGNDYSKGSGTTAKIAYTFDFSDIPTNAVIDSVTVKVGGHAENSTYNSSRKCELQLFSGSTAKSTLTHFTSTSKQILTLNVDSWTRAELQDAQLVVTLGYYGGLVNGVDFIVDYSIAETGTRLRQKVGSTYKKVKKVYQKTGSSTWSEVTDLDNIFTQGKTYKKG